MIFRRLVSLSLIAFCFTFLAGCKEQAKKQLHELIYLDPEAKVLGSWKAPAAAVFPHLIAAFEKTLPNTKLYPESTHAVVRYWHRDPERGPLRASLRLSERPEESGVSDLLVYPLRGSPDYAPHAKEYPPTEPLVRELTTVLTAAGVVPHVDEPKEPPPKE